MDLDTLNIDIDSIVDTLSEDIVIPKSNKKSKFNENTFLTIGNIISCSPNINTFINGQYPESYKVGIVINNNKYKYNCDVLYKGFLLKDILNIPDSLKEMYIQIFIKKNFDNIKEIIKQKMPRCKRLKRLNLKLLNKELVSILYSHFDEIIAGYQELFGSDYANRLKAQIVTTPFYIYDDNKFYIYKFDENKFINPEYEGANFLCYFTFSY